MKATRNVQVILSRIVNSMLGSGTPKTCNDAMGLGISARISQW